MSAETMTRGDALDFLEKKTWRSVASSTQLRSRQGTRSQRADYGDLPRRRSGISPPAKRRSPRC